MKPDVKPDTLPKAQIDEYVKVLKNVKKEIAKLVIGQERIIDGLIRGLLCNAHVLVEGIPGIAKTTTIRALALASGCEFSRIQFTVDLLPTDIIGLTAYDPKMGFYVVKGPIFANFVLADEINRSPPKTQSAMLESMQERQVTIGKTTNDMLKPFFVMATENPIESEGTFPLPEAQLDRFLFKLFMDYPTKKEEFKLVDSNITIRDMSAYQITAATTPGQIIEMQEAVKKVYTDDAIKDYIVDIVDSTRHPKEYGIKGEEYIAWGASPRASIGLFIASKAMAMASGRDYVSPQDVKDVAPDVLNHRMLLNYEGVAEGVKTTDIIADILKKVKTR